MKNKITQDSYLKAIQLDKAQAKAYYAKSMSKTEQQKALESILQKRIDSGFLDINAPYEIIDLACGGGTLSYHLANIFPNARFTLLDYNEDAIELAKELNQANRMSFMQGDLRSLPFENARFDLVFCWATFLMLDFPTLDLVLKEIHRILKPQGTLFASSLFNSEFDVDLKCDFRDLTRESGKSDIWGTYISPSLPTTQKLLENYSHFTLHKFEPSIDFIRTTHRGIATFTHRILEQEQKLEVDSNFGGAFVGEAADSSNSICHVEQSVRHVERSETSTPPCHVEQGKTSHSTYLGGGGNY